MTAAAASAPWLFSRRLDLLAFGGSAALSLLLVAVGAPLGLLDGAHGGGETPAWAWLACVVCVDVAHVWGNLLLVYADRAEFRSRMALWAFIPAAGFALMLALVSQSELLLWRALAAVAVWHFVRQQVGWVKLYRARNGELGEGWWSRFVDEGVTYAVTCGPIVWWHAHLPRPFWWLATGDFFVALPAGVGTAALCGEGVFVAAYVWKSVASWRGGRGNPGKDLVVATTALLWLLGIVVLQSDYAFTVTNVLIHGIPYITLIVITAGRRKAAGTTVALPLRLGALTAVAALLVLALAEEGLWDRLVWHERAWLFPFAEVDVGALRPLVVATLAVPQLTHYMLDAFLWRRRANPYVLPQA